MNSLVVMTVLLLVITKLMDVVSTVKCTGSSHDETNPVAQRMMRSIGVQKSSWAVFGIALVIIAAAGTAALSGPTLYPVAFVTIGVLISIVQAAVAVCNWTGRGNPVSKMVFTFHGIVGSLLHNRKNLR
jgi:hypothetical protein